MQVKRTTNKQTNYIWYMLYYQKNVSILLDKQNKHTHKQINIECIDMYRLYADMYR